MFSVQHGSQRVKPVLVAAHMSPIPGPAVEEKDGLEFVPDEGLLQGCLRNSETQNDLDSLVNNLDVDERDELVILINSYPSLFSVTPSQTHQIEHDIDVRDAVTIKQSFYCVDEEDS